ncbi:hypothetical protein F442_09062 [Phytophthora nicotianae P10297]|uniref:Uncharacterized protein n=1 Tax=Phytophthora nicotianae P10297 TaxID=1317064 RepID=W2ZAP2_PHYNI|nr:hypothetical protein F442_09062 [Phytophthora nicotianae P10297]
MAFASTTTTTLNKTFLSVQLIMQNIMRHNGGNAFRLSHIQKDKLLRAGGQDVCPSTILGLRRFLVLE